MNRVSTIRRSEQSFYKFIAAHEEATRLQVQEDRSHTANLLTADLDAEVT
jgi:hypothetical protein